MDIRKIKCKPTKVIEIKISLAFFFDLSKTIPLICVVLQKKKNLQTPKTTHP
jgi:hypothetical protein